MAEYRLIEDLSDPAVDIFARCTEAELLHYYEPNGGLFLAETPRIVTRALDAGCEPVSMLVETRYLTGEDKGILKRCEGIPLYAASKDVLSKLLGYPLTRGMLCAMRRPAPAKAEEIIGNAGRITVLENVTNPTNVGAIIRSAAALEMEAALLTTDCCDPLYRRPIRVSMGTVFDIPWAKIPGEDLVGYLHRNGFKTVALALEDDSVSIDDPVLKMQERTAVILGAEGYGLSEKTIRESDYVARIPMAAGVDSLNVAAASAVAYWELGKKL